MADLKFPTTQGPDAIQKRIIVFKIKWEVGKDGKCRITTPFIPFEKSFSIDKQSVVLKPGESGESMIEVCYDNHLNVSFETETDNTKVL